MVPVGKLLSARKRDIKLKAQKTATAAREVPVQIKLNSGMMADFFSPLPADTKMTI